MNKPKKIVIEKISYGGWDGCVRITDGRTELVVTTAVGPRVIRFGFLGGENAFCEIISDRGRRGGRRWRLYGGHRLWRAPEDRRLTYLPDNRPVGWGEIEGGVRVFQEEGPTGLRKEMEIAYLRSLGRVGLLHRMENRSRKALSLSLWAITAMAPGGTEFIPEGARKAGLLPDRSLVLWPYTRLDDPRVRWGEAEVALRQDPRIAAPFKIGFTRPLGRASYWNRGSLFIKTWRTVPHASYPDFGAAYETYANAAMLEMETLSPLVRLESGESAVHREEWSLSSVAPTPGDPG